MEQSSLKSIEGPLYLFSVHITLIDFYKETGSFSEFVIVKKDSLTAAIAAIRNSRSKEWWDSAFISGVERYGKLSCVEGFNIIEDNN